MRLSVPLNRGYSSWRLSVIDLAERMPAPSDSISRYVIYTPLHGDILPASLGASRWVCSDVFRGPTTLGRRIYDILYIDIPNTTRVASVRQPRFSPGRVAPNRVLRGLERWVRQEAESGGTKTNLRGSGASMS